MFSDAVARVQTERRARREHAGKARTTGRTMVWTRAVATGGKTDRATGVAIRKRQAWGRAIAATGVARGRRWVAVREARAMADRLAKMGLADQRVKTDSGELKA